MGVHARSAMPAGIRQALLDVVGAHGTLKALGTATFEVTHRQRCAHTAVATRRRSADVLLFAVFAWNEEKQILKINFSRI